MSDEDQEAEVLSSDVLSVVGKPGHDDTQKNNADIPGHDIAGGTGPTGCVIGGHVGGNDTGGVLGWREDSGESGDKYKNLIKQGILQFERLDIIDFPANNVTCARINQAHAH